MNDERALVVNDQFHAKQQEVITYFMQYRPKILCLYGSVRSGKTYCLIALFLMLVAANAGKRKMYLIAGNTKASVFRNVINDMEKILNRKIKLDRMSCFELFGNQILVLDGGVKGTNTKLRGNTLSGSLLNEGTTLWPEFVQETQNRTSDYSDGNGWLLCDTNPDSLQSYVYKNFVCHDGERLQSGGVAIKCFKITIWDNPFIPKDYVENLIKTTPEGHMMERMINGEWCNSSGMVWKDFDPTKHIINSVLEHYPTMDDFYDDVDYYFGSNDFGYEHLNVSLVFAKTYDGVYYVIEGCGEKRKSFEYFGAKFKGWYQMYKSHFTVYCDWARPDGIDEFEDMGIDAEPAEKAVLEGINTVATLFKTDKLFILKSAIGDLGKEQIEGYSWKMNSEGLTKDEPIKENDDFPDALRYGVHSDKMKLLTLNTGKAMSECFMM